MRSTVPAAGGAVTAALALALLSGCSGGSSSASGTASSGFCSQARPLVAEIESAAGRGIDVATLPASVQQLAGQLSGVQPPAAIASDWRSFTSSVQQLATTVRKLNPKDPQSITSLRGPLERAQQQLSASGERVESYLATHCPGSAATASATG